ncbi:hypothetical protein [Mycoplasma suis]|uniref:Uncharacterized protein n=1 Tax=Mycoplasma suis (strain Illinois) TaxID=768700 RepID=F0QR60_MYCSL|nr:hypothetical protein [Mycoplasma suis]ADX97980.1 hypothetical protein MSU_0444 [Mycoplasma suis str. Illinois]
MTNTGDKELSFYEKLKSKWSLADYLEGEIKEEIIGSKYISIECKNIHPFVFQCVLSWKLRRQFRKISRKEEGNSFLEIGKKVKFKCKLNSENVLKGRALNGVGIVVELLD